MTPPTTTGSLSALAESVPTNLLELERRFPEEAARGRPTCDKAPIAVAAEADGKEIGRIRLRHIANGSRKTLHGFIVESILPGSTDGGPQAVDGAADALGPVAVSFPDDGARASDRIAFASARPRRKSAAAARARRALCL